MQKSALEVAAKYEREAKERLRRMSLVAAGLETHAPKQSGNRIAATEVDLNDGMASDEVMTMPQVITGQS